MTPAEQRLETIATTHGPRVLAYLARRTSPVEDAADVYQEVLTTVWRKIHSAPDDQEHSLAWLLAIARRTLANHRRSQARRLAATQRLRGELTAYLVAEEGVGGEGALGAVVDREVDAVRSALAALGEEDREVLALTYWDGLTSDQVAVVVGISAAATRKRLQRARQRLEVALGAAGSAGLPPRETVMRRGSQRAERALTGQ
jgi:RNA polymerase sigma factor (sigma-70 family)